MEDRLQQYQKRIKELEERVKQLEDTNIRLQQGGREILIQKDYYHQFFNNSPVAIAQIDTKNKIININKAFETFFQYLPGETNGRDISALIVPEPLREENNLFLLKALQGEICEREGVVQRKDGSLINVLIFAVPIFNNGTIVSIYIMYTDITKLKKVQKVLQDTETLKSSILDAVPYALIGMRERRIIFANRSVEKVFGWKPEEIIGKTTRILYRSEDEFERIARDFYPKLKEQQTYQEEFPCRRKDGEDIYCMVSTSRIGNVLKKKEIVATFEDITQQEQITKVLKESKQKFSSLFYNHPEALAYLDKNSCIIDVNPRFEKLFGYSLDEIRGRNINDGMIHPDSMIEEGRNLDKIALVRDYFNYETVRKKKDGTLFPVLVSGAPITVNGKKKGIITLYIDISERKRKEKVQKAIYEISEAAYSVKNLNELYHLIHRVVSELMPARNFYIALYNNISKMVEFKYWADEIDPKPEPRALRKGITEYVFNSGKSLIGTPQVIEKLQKEGKIKVYGSLPVCWLGVPLKLHNKTVGVMATQSYTKGIAYTEEDKDILQFVSTQIAIAIERKQAEGNIILQKSLLQTLFDGAPMAIAMLDTTGKIITINKAFRRLFQYTKGEAKNHFISDIIVSDNLKEGMKRLLFRVSQGEVLQRETIRKKKDGSLINVSLTMYPIIVDRRVKGTYAIYTNITARKRSEQQLTYIATHDSLTDLPNRTLFHNYFELEKEITEQNRQKFALLLADLDNFKDINDTLGHKAGDELLKKAAIRLMRLLRKSDTVARYGGDEFVFLLPAIDSTEKLDRVMYKILNVFKEPFILGKRRVYVNLSIGGVIYPNDGIDIDTLIKKADTAMYYVKGKGKNSYMHYTPDLDKNI